MDTRIKKLLSRWLVKNNLSHEETQITEEYPCSKEDLEKSRTTPDFKPIYDPNGEATYQLTRKKNVADDLSPEEVDILYKLTQIENFETLLYKMDRNQELSEKIIRDRLVPQLDSMRKKLIFLTVLAAISFFASFILFIILISVFITVP